MKVISVLLSEKVVWLIHEDDPATYTLQSLLGWFLVNPLIYPVIASSGDKSIEGISKPIEASARLTAIIGKQVLVETHNIVFALPQDCDFDTESVEIETISEDISRFIMKLRSSSQQLNLSRSSIVVLSWGELLKLPAPKFPRIAR